MTSLRDEVVLITGASSGIGWAAALEFAGHGSRLALAARREDKLAELAKLVAAKGAECLTLKLDVSDTAQAKPAVDAVLKRWGRLDILVNNAGVMATRRFHAQSLEEMEEVMRTNYLGAAALIHAALPSMLARKKGHIVNVSSAAGIMGMPFMAAYSASKFALVGLTEALRREYYGTGVTLTAFCPGTVDTPMAAASLKDERLGKLAKPKSAAQVARKIASCCVGRAPVVIYADVPGFSMRASHFLPRLADWAIARMWQRIHPLGSRRSQTL